MAFNTSDLPRKDNFSKVVVIGFGRRLIAIIMDFVLIMFFSVILVAAMGFVAIFIQMYNPNEPLPMDKMLVWTTVILSLVYYVGFWSSSGQTLGKNAVGIQVIGKDGKKLTVGKAFLRFIGYIVSGALFSIGFFWAAVDKRRQGWHDKIAGTYVVDADTEFPADPEFVASDEGKKTWLWVVMWLVIGIISPIGFWASLWLLGPAINAKFTQLMQGLF